MEECDTICPRMKCNELKFFKPMLPYILQLDLERQYSKEAGKTLKKWADYNMNISEIVFNFFYTTFFMNKKRLFANTYRVIFYSLSFHSW